MPQKNDAGNVSVIDEIFNKVARTDNLIDNFNFFHMFIFIKKNLMIMHREGN